MQLHTDFMFLPSKRSTVLNRSFSSTPSLRQAWMNAVTFSICWKGMVDLLMRGHKPDSNLFAVRHRTCPSLHHSNNDFPSTLFSPLTVSIQRVTSSSRFPESITVSGTGDGATLAGGVSFGTAAEGLGSICCCTAGGAATYGAGLATGAVEERPAWGAAAAVEGTGNALEGLPGSMPPICLPTEACGFVAGVWPGIGGGAGLERLFN
mmetsp:Transcript_45876/g.106650  ORF Transcript_45876/g.106650 Transcript_45876/m.106650 type:complete len:207 (-) Transcript_45876:205-825(-)